MKAALRSAAAAAALLAPLAASLLAPSAHAATAAAAQQGSIATMSINSDAGLSPGATLRVQVVASPDARRASVTLGDSGVIVPLQEQSAGKYTGTHVVRRSERIDPMQQMVARVTYDERTVSRQFNFPPGFRALAMGAAAAAAPPNPVIDRLAVRAEGPLEPGRDLHFTLRGAPGGDAWLDIPGVTRGVDLLETRPGVYEGTYTVRERDDPDAFRTAIATLRKGDQRATARVGMDRLTDADRDSARNERRDDRAPQVGRASAPGGALPLHIASRGDNAVDADGNITLRGRTVPLANVRVQVQSVADVGGVVGITQPVADVSVQADRSGEFAVSIAPRGVPGARYDVHVTASDGSQRAEERLSLVQRRG